MSASAKVVWGGDSRPPFSGGRRPCRVVPEAKALRDLKEALWERTLRRRGKCRPGLLEGSPECPRRREAPSPVFTYPPLLRVYARQARAGLRRGRGAVRGTANRTQPRHVGSAPCLGRGRPPPGARRGQGLQWGELLGNSTEPAREGAERRGTGRNGRGCRLSRGGGLALRVMHHSFL